MRDSESRIKTQAVAIYLFWLRTGLSQELIATHIDSISQLDVSRYCGIFSFNMCVILKSILQKQTR